MKEEEKMLNENKRLKEVKISSLFYFIIAGGVIVFFFGCWLAFNASTVNTKLLTGGLILSGLMLMLLPLLMIHLKKFPYIY